MNQKELRVMEDLVDGVKTMAKNIKELNDTLKKNSSNTDKNTIMYKLVDAVKDLGKKFKIMETDIKFHACCGFFHSAIDALVAVSEHVVKFGKPVEIRKENGDLEYTTTSNNN